MFCRIKYVQWFDGIALFCPSFFLEQTNNIIKIILILKSNTTGFNAKNTFSG